MDDAFQGGWPQGALTEIVSRHAGFGFSMIVPTLSRLTKAGRYVALINTPYQPYAPSLDSRGIDLKYLLWIQPKTEDQALWTVEQLLMSGLLSAVAFWTRHALDGNTERRLQLAAESGHALALAFRTGAADASSYAALKLAVAPAADGQIAIDVLKCRGGRAGRRVFQPFAVRRAGRVA